jgi:hypothetical protein
MRHITTGETLACNRRKKLPPRAAPPSATRDMVREAGASPNTLKATFTSRVEKGILVRHGGGRATWYSLP